MRRASFAGTKFGGGGKRGRGGNSFPLNPLFCLPRTSGLVLAAPAARHHSGFCSKKVRAEFSNCDQSKLNDFSGRENCSLAPPSAGLASQKPFCLAIKSNGGRSPTRTCLASRRRFGIAKQFTNEICIQFFPFFAKGKNTKQIFNPALLRRRRNGQRRHYKLRSKHYENKIFSLCSQINGR